MIIMKADTAKKEAEFIFNLVDRLTSKPFIYFLMGVVVATFGPVLFR